LAKHKSASLSIKNLHTHYDLSHVLQGINLQIPNGEVTAIVGRNGVGKTTLINSIIGILNVTEGSILLERNMKREELIGLPSYSRKKHGIAIVPQGRRLFRSLTVGEHLYLVNPISEGPNNLDTIFEMFPILYDRRNSYANTLSGGEQSMLAIARALILNPDIILMDEPTEGLAPLLVNQVAEVILDLKKQGITILLVEQKLKFALDVSNTISIMERGIIAETIPREKIVDVNILIDKIMGK
jgi:branched-chain amino acid transport system ATP-binding protein